jgi:hypothetical protein
MTTDVPTLPRQMPVSTRRTPTWQTLMLCLLATIPRLLVRDTWPTEVPRLVVHVVSVQTVETLSVVAELPVADAVSAHWKSGGI